MKRSANTELILYLSLLLGRAKFLLAPEKYGDYPAKLIQQMRQRLLRDINQLTKSLQPHPQRQKRAKRKVKKPT